MATTSKKINFQQLDKELGGQGLIFDINDEQNKIILPAENSTVTEAELLEAINKHQAELTNTEVHFINLEQGIAKLLELGFTNEQIKALTGK
jgi:hypothetical protein